jgi:hypothetical protein
MKTQATYKWSTEVIEQAYCILNSLFEELKRDKRGKKNWNKVSFYTENSVLLENGATKEYAYYNGLLWLKDNKLIVVYFIDESNNIKIKFTEKGFFYFSEKYNTKRKQQP